MPANAQNTYDSVVAVVSSEDRIDFNTSQGKTVLETIIDLAEHGPRDDELAQAKAGFEREWLSALAPIGERADQLSYYATLFDDPGRINRELAEIEQLEPADITRAAARWLDPAARATLRYEVAERNQA